jgi:hypothetical protein
VGPNRRRAEASSGPFLKGHWHGERLHLGHLLEYLPNAAFSWSTLATLASEASHAMTSANSFSSSFLFFPSRDPPSSLVSSTSQAYVPLAPRSESLWKYSWRIMA